MPGFVLSSKVLFVILLLSPIPPHFCQLALASSPFLSFPSKKSAFLSGSGINVRDTRSRTLFTKFSDLRRPVLNSSAIESEIAAIFKNVAYGSSSLPTLSSSTTSYPSATTSSTTTAVPTEQALDPYFVGGVTESDVFIGKQKEVHPNIPLTSAEPDLEDYSKSVPLQVPEEYNNIVHNDSAYTYLIQSETYNEHSVKDVVFNNNKQRTRVQSYPSDESPENAVEEVQVRITSVLKKKGYDAIQEEIGNAWRFHVYLTGICFAVVSGVCLLSLSRVSACSNLLPRGYFVTLHLMIFLASFLRCLLFLHDPYGAYDRLPSVLTSLLFNTVGPCLSTAYAVVLMVLLRAARFRLVPLNMQSPLIIATLCGIHIGGSVVVDVSSGVLEDFKVISVLNVATQAITAFWGTILCLGYVVSFSSIEKAAQRQQGDLVRLTFNRTNNERGSLQKDCPRPSLAYAARIFLICTLLLGLLIAFVILNLVTTKVPISATSSEAWAWWTQASLERAIEIVFCVLILATAITLTQTKQRASGAEKDEKIFSIFSNCGRAAKGMKNIDVYPVANEKCNILGNSTITRSSQNSSLNYSTGGWKQYQQHSAESSLKYPVTLNSLDSDSQKKMSLNDKYDTSILFSPLQLIHASNTLRSQASHETGIATYGDQAIREHNRNKIPCQNSCYNYLHNYSKTLPRNNYYCPQQLLSAHTASRGSNSDPLETQAQSIYDPYRLSSNNTQFPVSTLQRGKSYDSEYEVAPYYSHSNASSSSHTYSKPYFYYLPPKHSPYQGLSEGRAMKTSKQAKNYEVDPKSVCSSQSEIHVDYLTDASSSNDCLTNTLSRSLTLPLNPQPFLSKNSTESNMADNTPDSAVGLDFSPQPDREEILPGEEENSQTDFLHMGKTPISSSVSGTLLVHPEFTGKSGELNSFSERNVPIETFLNATSKSGKFPSKENVLRRNVGSPVMHLNQYNPITCL